MRWRVAVGHVSVIAGLGLYIISLFLPATSTGQLGVYYLALSLALPMTIFFPSILLGTIVNITMLLSVFVWLQSADRMRTTFAWVSLAAVLAAGLSASLVETVRSGYYLWFSSVVLVSTAFWITPDFNEDDAVSPLERTFLAIRNSSLLGRATHAD